MLAPVPLAVSAARSATCGLGGYPGAAARLLADHADGHAREAIRDVARRGLHRRRAIEQRRELRSVEVVDREEVPGHRRAIVPAQPDRSSAPNVRSTCSTIARTAA